METNHQKAYELRIQAAEDSLKRSRLAFFTTTVVSLAVLFAGWNAYVSWYRGFVTHDKFSDNPVTAHAQKELISEWVKSHTISVALLGIRVGVSDAAPLASFTLLITTIWFFYCVRRENHSIGTLLIESKNEDIHTKEMIFHGIASQLVFIDLSGNDEPISRLSYDPTDGPHSVPFVRGMLRFLAFLPAMTIFFVIIMDILSIVYLRSVFRDPPHTPLLQHMGLDDWIWISLFECAALAIGVSATFLTARTLAFESGTARVLKEYRELMQANTA